MAAARLRALTCKTCSISRLCSNDCVRDKRQLALGERRALRAATLGGAKGFGRGKELGAVTKGRIADLVAFRLDGIAFTPLNNPINQLVYSGRNQSIS